MAHSLSKIYLHIIYHIKHPSIVLKSEIQDSLYAYMAGIIKDDDSIPIAINGVDNHVHILCVVSKNIAPSKFIEDIKRRSSKWLKTQGDYYVLFEWQRGYACYSVSHSIHEKTKFYIENQKAHHNKLSYQEEYELFLDKYQIEYDKNYLW